MALVAQGAMRQELVHRPRGKRRQRGGAGKDVAVPGLTTGGQWTVTDISGALPEAGQQRALIDAGQRARLMAGSSWQAAQGPWEASCGNSRKPWL